MVLREGRLVERLVAGWEITALELDAVTSTTLALLNEKPRLNRMDKRVKARLLVDFVPDRAVADLTVVTAVSGNHARTIIAAMKQARAICEANNRKGNDDSSKG
jgi:hypothetical protein